MALFADSVGQERIITGKNFADLTIKVKRKKITAASVLFDEMAHVIAPNDEDTLKQKVCAKVTAEPDFEFDKNTLKIVNQFVQLYLEEEQPFYKLHYLSFIVTYVPFSKIPKFFRGITYYYYQKALELSKKPKTIMIKEEARVQRWLEEQIDAFVDFITR